ncbi:uncharacterized protein IWZ02DRAFT_449583 [Phyllosticta citriasiana]|uniref:uncharacterized protein n=1 Tax=Phyllosticta citriasiana TaxID=595635 RepID=UPI0030FD660A
MHAMSPWPGWFGANLFFLYFFWPFFLLLLICSMPPGQHNERWPDATTAHSRDGVRDKRARKKARGLEGTSN